MQTQLSKIKWPLIALALALCSAFFMHAAEEKEKSASFVIGIADTPRLVIDNGPTYLTFQCGIQVNCKTGDVKIPDGMKIDEASRKFWIGLADAYPGVREAWVSGYLAAKGRQ